MPAMDAARGIKDEYEIRMIRQANKVSGLAHREILERIQGFSNESEIEGSFLNTCVSNGARNQAYQIIAASGPNAAVLHYDRNNEPLHNKPLVCLDAGAEWNCYASDVTRTFPLSGEWPSDYARDIYKLVERMQEECIRGMRKGVRYLSLHNLAHDIAIEIISASGCSRTAQPLRSASLVLLRYSSLMDWDITLGWKSTMSPKNQSWHLVGTARTGPLPAFRLALPLRRCWKKAWLSPSNQDCTSRLWLLPMHAVNPMPASLISTLQINMYTLTGGCVLRMISL